VLARFDPQADQARCNPVCLIVQLRVRELKTALTDGGPARKKENGSFQILRKIHTDPLQQTW
jgi:hypothetical protein